MPIEQDIVSATDWEKIAGKDYEMRAVVAKTEAGYYSAVEKKDQSGVSRSEWEPGSSLKEARSAGEAKLDAPEIKILWQKDGGYIGQTPDTSYKFGVEADDRIKWSRPYLTQLAAETGLFSATFDKQTGRGV